MAFRTQLSGTNQISAAEIVPYIEQWINSTSGFVVYGSYVKLLISCSVVISNFDFVDCPEVSVKKYQDLAEPVIGGILGGILMIMLLVTVVVVIACLKAKRRNRADNASVHTVNR